MAAFFHTAQIGLLKSSVTGVKRVLGRNFVVIPVTKPSRHMKTMLILTDFSENAFRAAEYAAQLAVPLRISRIILFHAYQTVVAGTDLPVTNTSTDQQFYLERMEGLALLQDRLKTMMGGKGNAAIDLLAEDISLPAYLNERCKKEGVDIIVMGVSGKSGLEKLLLGSTTSMLIEESKAPVMIVPKDTMIGREIKTIVFTTDLKDPSVIPVHELYEFLDAFPAEVRVVNVAPRTDEKYSYETESAIAELRAIFEKYNAVFDYIREDNIVDGIHSYAAQHHTSLIIVVPQKHGFFSSFFQKSISKKLAYNSDIPLLTLPPGK